MADQPRAPGPPEAEKRASLPAGPLPLAGTAAEAGVPRDQTPANPLSPEEQMALFEKELKETDWGHQPC